MADTTCKRTMDCRCPDCAAAMAAFSVNDLKQFSSNISYGEEEEDSNDKPSVAGESIPPPRPPPAPAPAAVNKSEPSPTTVPMDEEAVPPAQLPSSMNVELSKPKAVRTSSGDRLLVSEGAGAPGEEVVRTPCAPSMPAPPVPAADGGIVAEPPQPPKQAVAGNAHEDGPLEDRLKSANWKIRKAAYEEMKGLWENTYEPDDPTFSEYDWALEKMANDANASALEAALGVVHIYAERCGSAAQKAETLVPLLINKALGGRPGTVAQAELVLLKLMEIDVPNPVCEILLTQGLKSRKPKVPPVCVGVISKALEAFGAKAMPLTDLLKGGKLKAMFDSSNAGVRSAAQNLYVDLYKWIGPAPLKALLEELKSSQQAALASQVEGITPGQMRPTVYLRKDRPKEGEEEVKDDGGSQGGDAVDPREFVDAVDLIGKLAKSEFEAKIAETKWSEKVEGMKIVLDIIGPVPKLSLGGDYGDLVRLLKGLVGHSHFQVAGTAARTLAAIADGLRRDFYPFSRMVFQAYIAACKDKKLVTAIGESLDVLYRTCLNLDQVVDDLDSLGLDTKKNSPAGRICLLNWLGRCLDGAEDNYSFDTLVALTKVVLTKCIGESEPKLREATICALICLVKAAKKMKPPVGGPVWQAVQKLQEKNARVFKRIEKDVGGPAGSAPAPAPAASSEHAKPKAPGMAKKKSTTSLRKKAGENKPDPPKRTAGPGSKSRPSKPPLKSSAPPAAMDTGGDEEEEDIALSPEEAEDFVAGLGIDGWEDTVAPGLSSTKWQEKKTALEAIKDYIQGGSAEGQVAEISGPIIIFLGSKTRNFKESNFNIMKEVYEITVALAEASDESSIIDRRAVAKVMAVACEKLSDKKLKDPISSLLMALCEVLGPPWVTAKLFRVVAKVRAPLAHVEALLFLGTLVNEFGISAMNVQKLAGFATSEMDSSNPKVRTSAVELLGIMYHQLGPPLRAIALPDSLSPASASLIEAEFDKVGFDPAAGKTATRTVRTAPEGEGGGQQGGGGALPRIDLQTLLDSSVMKNLNCTEGNKSWRGRKEAMEAIGAACERSGNHLEANKFVVEVLKALRPRLLDSQSNNKPLAATTIAALFQAIGSESAPRFLRLVAEQVLAGVADNKKIMMNACLESLTNCVTFNGELSGPAVDALLPFLAEALVKKVNRVDLLGWMVQPMQIASGDCAPLVAPLFDATCDKNATTRSKAEEVLILLASRQKFTKRDLDHATRDFNPATKRSLAPALARISDAFLGGGGAGSSSMPPPDPPQPRSAPSSPAKAQRKSGVARGRAGAGGAMRRSRSQASNRTSSSRSMASVAKEQAAPPSPTHSAATEESHAGGGGGGILKRNNGKGKREQDARRTRWPKPPEVPGKDEAEMLRGQWEKYMNDEMLDILFPRRVGSQDCGIPGLELFEAALTADEESFTDHLDLIFKWLTIRLSERENVKALNQMLNLLIQIFDMLRNAEYRMLDFEAAIFVPWILEKSGQSKDRFKQMTRRIMEQICDIYPSSKYMKFVLDGLVTKNARTKATLLDEVRRIISITPLSVLGKSGVKTVASFLDTREQEVRAAALDCIQVVYESLGNDFNKLKKLTGELSGKAVELIQDRIKQMIRQGGGTAAPRSPTNRSSVSPRSRSQPSGRIRNSPPEVSSRRMDSMPINESYEQRYAADQAAHDNMEQLGQEPYYNGEDEDVPMYEEGAGPFGFDDNELPEVMTSPQAETNGSSFQHESFPVDQEPPEMAEEGGGVSDEMETQEMYERIIERLDRLLELPLPFDVNCEDYSEGHETLKLLHEIATCVHQERLDLVPEEEVAAFVLQARAVVPRMIQTLKISFKSANPKLESEVDKSNGSGGLDFRLFSKAIAALMATLRLSEVIEDLTRPALSNLIETLALGLSDLRLHDVNGPYAEHRSKALSAMNKLILQVSTESPRGAIFAALFDLLLLCVPSPGGKEPVFSEMVCQVLTRLFLKVLKKEMAADPPFGTMDMQQVVWALHSFFEKHPKNGTQGKPYLAARNLFWNLCQVLGNQGMESELHACGVPPGSEVHSLLAEHRQEKENNSLSSNSASAPSPRKSTPAPQMHTETEDVKTELARLMNNISQRPQEGGDSSLAVEDLYRFKKQHPEIDIFAEFSGLSVPFKRFISNQLDQLEARERGSSQPMSSQQQSTDENENVKDRLKYLRERLNYNSSIAGSSGFADLSGSRLTVETKPEIDKKQAIQSGSLTSSDLRSRLESLKRAQQQDSFSKQSQY